MLLGLGSRRPRGETARGASYLVIGAVAFSIDVGLFALLHASGVPPLVANLVSTAAALLWSFSANAVFTFGVTDHLLRRFVWFAAVAGCGFAISSAMLWCGQLLAAPAVLIKIAAVPIVVVVQYLLNSRFTFADAAQPRRPRPPTRPNAATGRPGRVAVIGAGFTGLAAAYELAKAGHRVEVLEAAPNVGGLAAGFALDDGLPLERAYHFAYTTDRHLIAMADELGVGDRLRFHPSTISAHVAGKAYPFTSATDLLRFSPLSVWDRLRTGLTYVVIATVRNWRRLSGSTAYAWLCRVNGCRATDLLWKPLLQGKFDTYWDQVSMAWLWGRIRVRQSSHPAGDRRQHLGYFDGGFGVIVQRWLEELDRLEVTVRTGTRIQTLGERHGRPRLTFDRGEVGYDAVLVTVPSPVFGAVASAHPAMTAAYSAQLTSVRYLAALIMIVVSSQRLTDTYWHQIHDTDAPFLVVLSLDALVGTEATGGRHVYYIGDYLGHADPTLALDDAELRRRWFTALHGLFADFDAAQVEECHVFRFRNAQHIVGIDYQHTIPEMQTPLSGYYLANFAQIFPDDRGTNYAIRDGIAAAHLINQRLAERGPDPEDPDSASVAGLEPAPDRPTMSG